jgi:predicted lipoprotein
MIQRLIRFAVLAAIAASCSGNGPEGPADGFDRGAMLASMADGYIVPQYNEGVRAAQSLEAAVVALTTTPTENHVLEARRAWIQCAEQWQRIVMFDFGPAEGTFGDLVQIIGTFPSNTQRIETLIAAGDTSTTSFERDVRGVNALDYLLFASTEADIVSRLTAVKPSNYGAYMRSVARHVVTELVRVRDAWSSSYSATFKSNVGTDAGSSTSSILNNIAMSFEVVKNDKVGLPGGFRAGQKRPEPERVEARYSGQSLRLAREHVEAIRMFWEGQVPSTSGASTFQSVRHYLSNVVGGPRLIDETRAQFAAVMAAFDTCGDTPIHVLASSSDARLATLHTELQKLTRYLKSELSSLLGIAITYSSGDGD